MAVQAQRWDRRRRRNRKAMWACIGWAIWVGLMFGLFILAAAVLGPS